MKPTCIKCQVPLTVYYPEHRSQPELFVCTQCGIVAIPQAGFPPLRLAQLVELPQEVNATSATN